MIEETMIKEDLTVGRLQQLSRFDLSQFATYRFRVAKRNSIH